MKKRIIKLKDKKGNIKERRKYVKQKDKLAIHSIIRMKPDLRMSN